MDKKCKLVFFSSGDFPYYTIEQILSLKLYDVAGIVTSEYKSITIGSTIEDLANKYKIPCLKIHQNSELKSDKTLSWLKEKNADIFCVISFKYLPNEILSIPKITSFNIQVIDSATTISDELKDYYKNMELSRPPLVLRRVLSYFADEDSVTDINIQYYDTTTADIRENPLLHIPRPEGLQIIPNQFPNTESTTAN